MPVDSHELVAMYAPRPVFISAGEKSDGWQDARGMFMGGMSSGHVYRLLGKKDLGTTVFPPIETALIDGSLLSGSIAARIHPFLAQFLTFSDHYLAVGK